MTLFGKLLVYLNLLLGMAFLSWSVGLYTHKIDWIDRTNAAGEKVEGEISRLRIEIDGYLIQDRVASKGWGDTHEALKDAEKTREDRQAVFATRLKAARDNPMNAFYMDVFIPGTALVAVDKQGAEIKGPDGLPLRGSETLLEQALKNDKETTNFLKSSDTLKKDQNVLQQQEKLLQERVNRHSTIYDNLLNEQRYLETFEINWYEQLITVQRRKTQLQKRLAEFQ
jgi:hypothetical protein